MKATSINSATVDPGFPKDFDRSIAHKFQLCFLCDSMAPPVTIGCFEDGHRTAEGRLRTSCIAMCAECFAPLNDPATSKAAHDAIMLSIYAETGAPCN